MPVLAPPPPAAICRTATVAVARHVDDLRPLLAADAVGDGALVWGSRFGYGPVRARVLRHGAPAARTTTLTGGRVSGLRVRPARGGGALLSFRRLPSGRPVVVALSDAGRFGRRGVPAAGGSVPDVAMDSSGTLRAVWIDAADPDGPSVLTATAPSPAGPWSPPAVVAQSPSGSWGMAMTIGDKPRIAPLAGGRWVVAWREFPAVAYAALGADGVPVAPPVALGDAVANAAPPELRASAGRAIVAWTEFAGPDVHITATRIAADGTHTPPVVLSGPRVDGVRPPVVLTGPRHALIGWVERAPGHRVARVVRMDMASGAITTWATAPIASGSGIGGATAGGRAAIAIRQASGARRRTRVLVGRLDGPRATGVVTADAGVLRFGEDRAPAVAVTASGRLVVAAEHWTGESRAVLRLSRCGP